MFSRKQKQMISEAVEKVLLEIDHPEMPKNKPMFELAVVGREPWSWAVIKPNWTYENKEPESSEWNEKNDGE